MAIADKGTLGSGVSFSSSTSCTGATATTADVGDIIVLYTATDNTSTTTGTNNEVSSVTDPAGNTYTKLGEYTNSPGGVAADGVTTSVWLSRVTTQLVSGQFITATFSGSRVMKVWGGRVYTVTAGATLTQSATAVTTAVTAANDFGSAAFSGLSSKERLYFRGMGKEANTTAALTTTTNYTSLSGGRSTNDPLAVTAKGEFRIVTATGETSNPTLAVSGDTASVFVALEELVLNPTPTPAQAAVTLTGLVPLALIALIPAAAALTFTGQAPSVVAAAFRAPAQSALVLTGPTPTVAITDLAGVIQPPAGALVLAGQAPAVSIGSNVAIAVPSGALRFKGPAGPNPVFQPDAASLTITTTIPVPTFKLATPGPAALVLTGQLPIRLVTPKGTFQVPTGTLTLAGQFVGQGIGFLQAGTLDIAGLAPSLRFGAGPIPGSDALVLTGLVPTIKVNAAIAVPAGALEFVGQAPNALTFGVYGPAAAALSLGGPVPQVVIGLAPSPTMTPGPATLTFTGYAPGGLPNQAIAVPVATLTLAGQLPVREVVGISLTIAVPTGALVCSSTAIPPVLKYFYVISPAPARLRLLGPDPEMAGIQFGTGKPQYPAWQSVVTS